MDCAVNGIAWNGQTFGSRRFFGLRQGKIDTSLADFAKLVETFDAHGVSFVSVT